MKTSKSNTWRSLSHEEQINYKELKKPKSTHEDHFHKFHVSRKHKSRLYFVQFSNLEETDPLLS